MDITIPYGHTPREYQRPLWKAIQGDKKRAVVVWHRRSGKDLSCVNVIVSQMLKRVGTYYHIFPTYNQGRKILWDGMDKEGRKFLDYFPKELIEGKPNDTDMKLKFKNGSMFQIIGSDKIDSIVGTNPIGVVFSEYSLQDPKAWGFIRPILAENGGWAIFDFTPRGENHAYDLYELAKADPDNWFCQLLTVDDTQVIPREVLDQERREIIREHGDDGLYRQEYYCDFSVAIPGAYYAHQISQAYQDGRVGKVPHEPRLVVNTHWDLGINDKMAIWFSQTVGAEVRFIDYLEDSGKGLDHYIKATKAKDYVYGTHTAPHDIQVRELTSGKSRLDTARNLGIDFEVATKLPLNDGIDAGRSIFPKCWFDGERCRDGLNALKSYHKIYDEKKRTYLNHPYHDWSSNGADAFRYFAVSHEYEKSEYVEDHRLKDKYARHRDRQPEFSPMSL